MLFKNEKMILKVKLRADGMNKGQSLIDKIIWNVNKRLQRRSKLFSKNKFNTGVYQIKNP